MTRYSCLKHNLCPAGIRLCRIVRRLNPIVSESSLWESFASFPHNAVGVQVKGSFLAIVF